MKLIKKIKNKIKRRLAEAMLTEMETLRKEKSRKRFDSIVSKGKDSFFWGKDIYISDPSKVQLGSNVHIGNNAYLKTEGGLKIGDNTHISRNLVLYTVNHNYKSDILPYNNELICKEVSIGKNVWIGMNVCIAPGTVIGDGCIIGMGSIVSGVVPELSIIGSEKWRVLGSRDADLYNEINLKGRFGKENGHLYTPNNTSILSAIGDRIVKNRSTVEVMAFEGKIALKKTFENSIDGTKSYQNEIGKYKLFEKHGWIPKVYAIGEDFIVTEFFDNACRLDNYIKKSTNSKQKNSLLCQILLCLVDIYGHKVAHCDFHAKNIFVTPDGIKIIDFEASQDINNDLDFFDSYDMIGEGLDSPYRTNKMCVMNSTSRVSLSAVFEIVDIHHVKRLFNSFLIEELYDISGSFFTRKNKTDKRHSLKNRYIYSTFDLKYLKVDKNIGQRNIKKRFEQFNIKEQVINGKKILDIGSNIGGILFEIHKFNPQSALGVEYDSEKVLISNRIKFLHGIGPELEFIQQDVESEEFMDAFKEKYDVVFCLAVIAHLKNQNRFMEKLGELCSGLLYFEGNSGTDVEFVINELKRVGFSEIEFIGNSKDEVNESNNTRPLFIARKES